MLLRKLNLHMPVPKAQLNINKVASKVGVRGETQRKALEILGEADRLKITVGKGPLGLAAAALYMACNINGESRTQEALAKAAGITEVTLQNRYKDLEKVLSPMT